MASGPTARQLIEGGWCSLDDLLVEDLLELEDLEQEKDEQNDQA